MRSGEFALIAQLLTLLGADDDPTVVVGPGDDAAVLDLDGVQVAVTTDVLVDGVHVDRTLSSLEDLGHKALAVNLSDLAAVGAEPVAAVVGLQRPPDLDDEDAVAIYRGLRAAADRWRCRLVGGDTTNAPVLAVAVAALGRCRGRVLRRQGARPGEAVLVVGTLGAAAAALALHRRGLHGVLDAYPELAAAHRRPVVWPQAGRVLAELGAGAAIDVSDGLGRDLAHLAAASGVAVELDADALPVSGAVVAAAAALGTDPLEFVLGGGDDYALVATLAPEQLEAARRALAPAPTAVVGRVVAGHGVWLVTPAGRRDVSDLGWEHR